MKKEKKLNCDSITALFDKFTLDANKFGAGILRRDSKAFEANTEDIKVY